jgi:uncharacterized protein (UPF0333 family)
MTTPPTNQPLAIRRKGQGIVEFALVFPILIVTILAMVEFGMYLKDALGLRYATLSAARTIAAQGTNAADDSNALLVIQNVGLLSLVVTNVDYIEVYKANGIADDCPYGASACSPGQPHYPPATLDMMYSWQYSSTLQTYIWMPDSRGLNNWKPGLRNDVIPTDVAGVYIQYHHYWVDPLLHSLNGNNGHIDMNIRSIMPIEPACYSSDASFCHSQH